MIINNLLTIVFYITITYFILMAIAWLYNVYFFLKENRDLAFSPKFYLKEIPFLIDIKAIYRVRTAGQFIGIIILTAILSFTLINNLTPLGVTVQYAMDQNSKSISQLAPKDRVITENVGSEKLIKIKGDLVYFSTIMPFIFEKATVRVLYKNSVEEQTFSIGFRDQEDFHYEIKPYEAPFINKLSWIKNGYYPILYQRSQKYLSADNFLNDPPTNAVIGTFEYESNIGSHPQQKLPTYKPLQSETIINTPLRGSHTMYVYLTNEPFQMTVKKQDLNWYIGKDKLTVKIYKDQDKVYEVTAEDDGIDDDSHQTNPPVDIMIKNPSKDLPENGIYKVVIEANNDTIIKQIKTNLHKIVFANAIFPAGNSSVYKGVIASTSATKVFTNALTISAETNHDQGKQNILVGDQILGVNTLKRATYIPPNDYIAEVNIPKNDVVLNGFMGYFAFSRDQFFLPTKYHILPITKPEDVVLVDYILTDYHPSGKEGEWQVNEQTFDLRTAYIKNNKLSWIIKAPKLKERGGEIIIKDIQITFHKKGWL